MFIRKKYLEPAVTRKKMKISARLLPIFMWMTICCGVSLSWSTNINSMFTSRGLISQTVSLSGDVIQSIANGAQMAMNQCQRVFRWDKWNCPESAFSRRHTQSSTREQAVAHAIISAGIVHAVTRNCSKGQLTGCGCNTKSYGLTPTNPPYITRTGRHLLRGTAAAEKSKINWSWGGCSDDIEYGLSISKLILDELERGSDTRAYVNLHNNLVGRTIIRNSMVRKCRCHGVSGSCSLQTCWMQAAPFEKVSNMLRQRYSKAIKIDVENRANRFSISAASAEIDVAKYSHINSQQLVFVENSPDYCNANNTNGWPGTKGRACSRSRLENVSPMEKRSCRNLCRNCGYKVKKYQRQIKWNCNCSFKWCCEVQCNVCTKTVEEYFCD